MKRFALLALALASLAGCNTVPPTNVHQPMTVRPQPRPELAANNGSIYQAGYSRPLFEDRKARFVGDTLTVKITENTSASVKSSAKNERSSSIDASVDALSRLPGKSLLGLNVNASNTNNLNSKGEGGNNNIFSGTMTATVIEVLPNGNLMVSGEKQLAIGHQTEYVRVSGVVNPSFVDSTNMIDSSKIADARIEYKSAGYMSEAQVMGWMARFFLSVLPF